MDAFDPSQVTFTEMLARFYRSRRVEVDPDLWMGERMRRYRGGPQVDASGPVVREDGYGWARGGFHDATWACRLGEGGRQPLFWSDGAGRHEGAVVAALPGLLYVEEGFDRAAVVHAVIERHLAEAKAVESLGLLGTATVGPDEVDLLRAFHRHRVALRMRDGGPVPEPVARAYEAMTETDGLEGYPREEGWRP